MSVCQNMLRKGFGDSNPPSPIALFGYRLVTLLRFLYKKNDLRFNQTLESMMLHTRAAHDVACDYSHAPTPPPVHVSCSESLVCLLQTPSWYLCQCHDVIYCTCSALQENLSTRLGKHPVHALHVSSDWGGCTAAGTLPATSRCFWPKGVPWQPLSACPSCQS